MADLINNAICEWQINNKSLFAGSGYPEIMIIEIEGLTGLELDIQTSSNPQISGVNVDNMKARERYIQISFHTNGADRERLISFFNPWKEGKFIITWNGYSRWINFIVVPIKVIQRHVYNDIDVTVRLFCPAPYFNDMSDYGKDIAAVQPLFVGEHIILSDRGCIVDYRLLKSRVNISNTGDVEVPVRIVFKAKGTAKNPVFIINNGSYMKMGTDANPFYMYSGDTIIFETDPTNIQVLYNGEDILDKTDPYSDFFLIPIGNNIIEYKADEGLSNLSVTVFFTPQYLGV